MAHPRGFEPLASAFGGHLMIKIIVINRCVIIHFWVVCTICAFFRYAKIDIFLLFYI